MESSQVLLLEKIIWLIWHTITRQCNQDPEMNDERREQDKIENQEHIFAFLRPMFS